MIIDYNTEKIASFPKFKGGEGELAASMFFDGTNRMFQGVLTPGSSIGLHRHDTSSEIIFVISGTGKIILEGKEERIGANMCHYCPKGQEHTFINDSDENIVFFAVVAEQSTTHE